MIREALVLTRDDLAHALRGAVWRRVDHMPDDLCPGWGERHETLWDRLEEQEWDKDETVVYIFDGILWRCREKGGGWCELDDERLNTSPNMPYRPHHFWPALSNVSLRRAAN